MSEYKAKQDETTRIWRVYDVIGGVVAVGHTSSQELAIILNDETAALRQQIADLQAENAKLKADCVSYDKVLNDVAIGYLEATEKLHEAEMDESSLYKQIDCPKCKGQCKFDYINDEGDGEYKLCRLCEYTGCIYLRGDDAYRFMRDTDGEYKYLLIPLVEITPYMSKVLAVEAKESPVIAETEAIVMPVAIDDTVKTDSVNPKNLQVRVNWSGNGFSSGSYKRLATFVRSEKLWSVIEIDRANKISQLTLLSEKCEVVL